MKIKCVVGHDHVMGHLAAPHVTLPFGERARAKAHTRAREREREREREMVYVFTAVSPAA